MSIRFDKFIKLYIQMKCIYQHQLRYNDGRPLEIYCLQTLIFQIVDSQHPWVDDPRELREYPFEGCEKWRIIESPF
jgi:hypothetical protein